MSNGDGSRRKPTPDRPWGTIEEVFIEEIPPASRPIKQSKWTPLYLDVVQYLNEAPETCALKVPLADRKAAQRAYEALRKMATADRGSSDIFTFTRRENVLYVQRGPDWPRKAQRDPKRTVSEHHAVDYD